MVCMPASLIQKSKKNTPPLSGLLDPTYKRINKNQNLGNTSSIQLVGLSCSTGGPFLFNSNLDVLAACLNNFGHVVVKSRHPHCQKSRGGYSAMKLREILSLVAKFLNSIKHIGKDLGHFP